MEEFQSAINWFEIPAADFDRAVRFYSEIFAYEIPTRDMASVLERVEGAGGAVVMGKSQLSPEIGFIAVIEDTEGNRVYLHSMN